MPKKKITTVSPQIWEIKNKIRDIYNNKYYNLFFNTIGFEGLEEQERRYVMKQLWIDGTVAMTPIPYADKLVFAPYSQRTINLYGDPSTINLVNEYQSPLIPSNTLTVDQDVVIAYLLHGKRSMKSIVDKYIDRIVNVEMVINTNLIAHKMPILVGVSPEDVDKVNDIIKRLLADEPVIFADMEDLQLIKSVISGAPYLIDKLYQYKCALEGELQTWLGVDNVGVITHTERALVDEVNSGNIITNAMLKGMIDNLQSAFDRAATLWPNIPPITVVSRIERSMSVHEDKEGGKADDQHQL